MIRLEEIDLVDVLIDLYIFILIDWYIYLYLLWTICYSYKVSPSHIPNRWSVCWETNYFM